MSLFNNLQITIDVAPIVNSLNLIFADEDLIDALVNNTDDFVKIVSDHINKINDPTASMYLIMCLQICLKNYETVIKSKDTYTQVLLALRKFELGVITGVVERTVNSEITKTTNLFNTNFNKVKSEVLDELRNKSADLKKRKLDPEDYDTTDQHIRFNKKHKN